jgi:hypothetical protein
MSITPFLAGQSFNPSHLEAMSAAFVDACKALSISESDHHRTALVARHVIELGQRGFRNRTVIYFLTLKKFRSHEQQNRRLALLLKSIMACAWAVILAAALDTVLSALDVPPSDVRTYALIAAASLFLVVFGVSITKRA